MDPITTSYTIICFFWILRKHHQDMNEIKDKLHRINLYLNTGR